LIFIEFFNFCYNKLKYFPFLSDFYSYFTQYYILCRYLDPKSKNYYGKKKIKIVGHLNYNIHLIYFLHAHAQFNLYLLSCFSTSSSPFQHLFHRPFLFSWQVPPLPLSPPHKCLKTSFLVFTF